MKKWISRIFGAAIAVFVCSAAISAQNDTLGAAAGDRYVISAKAGGVNYVSGTATVIRTEGKSGQLLKGDKLEIGDRVTTGADGKAEILLNPGSYLRLGSNSVFEFKTTDLDNLEISLDSGSAMFEVFATEDFTVTVNTPKTKFALIESGIYRVDVSAGGNGKVAVWKGKARVGDDEKAIVKSGREGIMAGSQPAITKFDRDDRDDLALWSKDRAKDLAKITGRLQHDNMRTALMRSFLGRQWNMYGSFGLWVWDPFSRSNCFLPFGYGWGSPYGHWFSHSIWNYNLPQTVFYPPNNGGPVRPVKTVRNVDGPIRQPPFVRAQGTSGSTGRDFGAVKRARSADTGPMIASDPIRSSGSMPSSSSSSGSSSSEPVRSAAPTKGRP
jgi:hypothetical protein